MEPSQISSILQRLQGDYDLKDKGEWLREGRCPSCSKKSLYAHAHTPWLVRCGRENNCRWEATVKELYPDLFADWSKRYPATSSSPTATADAYLTQERGLDLTLIRGSYTQEHFYDRDKKLGTPTVRFALPGGGWWERLLEHTDKFDKKANFAFGKSYKGYWWQLPQADLTDATEVWIVEGIFDAVALAMVGKVAVSAMSSVNYPDKALDALRLACAAASKKRPRIVWALDHDKSGSSNTRRWAKQAANDGWEVAAAQIPPSAKKQDWNDLLLARRLDEGQRQRLFDEALYHGELLLAERPSTYALAMYRHTELRTFWFFFRQRLYWFELDLDRYEKAVRDVDVLDEEEREQALIQSSSLVELAGCAPQALYYQRNEVTDDSWYYFRVDFPNGGSIKNTFTPGQVTAAGEWKKRLAGIGLPGAIWTGSPKQLDRFLKDQLGGLKTVDTIDFIGYSKQHKAFVFGDVAVQAGKLYHLNHEDFFDLKGLSLKSLQRSMALTVNTDLGEYSDDWLLPYLNTYGAQGLVVLAFWFGCLFVEQIRSEYRSYPFLEMVGEPGSGKTTLVKFLWKLMGREDHEGFDPNKSTAAGRARTFTQVAGLPVVLMEGDADMDNKQRRFNWEDLKPLFNGNSMRTTGAKTGGNETYEPPFRGAIVIEQNQPVDASAAILTRIVQLTFTRKNQTETTYQLAKRLEAWPMEQLSGFIVKAAMAESAVMERLAVQVPLYERVFKAMHEVREFRIAQNHAMLMALVDALDLVLPITLPQKEAALALLQDGAIARQRAINADHPLVQQFWEVFEYLDGGEVAALDHSRDPAYLAINLNHFYEVAERHSQRLPPVTDMKHLLKNSRRHPYVDQKVVNSAIFVTPGTGSKSLRCWCFKKERD